MNTTARFVMFFALVLGGASVGCSADDGGTGSDESNVTSNQGTVPTTHDSITCTVEGLTVSARLGEGPAKLEVKGVPGAENYTLDTSTGDFSYKKMPSQLSERAVMFGRDRNGAWVVLDVTWNGDEDYVTTTVSLPDQPAVTRQVAGGDYYCTIGSADPETRRAGRGR